MDLPERCAVIDRALSYLELPDGITIRRSRLASDVQAINALPMGDDDTMQPAYGMGDDDDVTCLTLVIARNGAVIGQINATTVLDAADGEASLAIDGLCVFVSDAERMNGLGHLLGHALLTVSEALRRDLGLASGNGVAGDILISADTASGTAGEAVANRMITAAEALGGFAWDDEHAAQVTPGGL